ncbi:hypothetical protein D9M70_576880 [compost metagenome]
MRELSASFVALCNRIAKAPETEDLFEFERARVLIRLRLNADPEHAIDARLLEKLKVLAERTRTRDFGNLTVDIEEFEIDMQTLLKREWDKSKREAETGNIAPPDKKYGHP